MPQISVAYISMPQISVANTSMPQISAANTSMTRVSPFENGRNEKIMSYRYFLSPISLVICSCIYAFCLHDNHL